MSDKKFSFSAVLTTTLTTNILNGPAQAAAGVGIGAQNIRLVLTHIRIINKHATLPATYSLYKGGTGGNVAGTEFMGTTRSVAVGSYDEWYGRKPFDTADFLVGGASVAAALTIEGEGYMEVL